jgi:serine/threonine protein kinase
MPASGSERILNNGTDKWGFVIVVKGKCSCRRSDILGELGRGGMGIVYKAKDLRIDRLVAVKLILSGRGANFTELARFRIEAEAVGSLEHPNIVQSHDIGVHLGYPFFVLECHRALQNQPLMGAFRTSHPLRAVSLINFTSLDGSRFGS